MEKYVLKSWISLPLFPMHKGYIEKGGGQNLERLIFRNFKIANIKSANDELFDSLIFKLLFHFL